MNNYYNGVQNAPQSTSNSTGRQPNYANFPPNVNQVSSEWNQLNEKFNQLNENFNQLNNTVSQICADMGKVWMNINNIQQQMQVNQHNFQSAQESLIQRVKRLEENVANVIISLNKENAEQRFQMRNETKKQNLSLQYANKPSIAPRQNDEFVVDAMTERDFKLFTREICESSISEPSFGRKAAQNKFFNKWHIERFICSNESVREKSPDIAPEFMTDEVNGYYWAALLDKPGYYMVYPDPSLSYEQSRHSSKGYKEVFKTGYQNGAYKFIPKVPAVFKKQGNQWNLVSRGELRLEFK